MNADIGGGKWDLTTEFLAGLGVTNVIYDRFNRDPDWNEKALARIEQGCHTATVSNVLNVIAEAEVRREVIELARYAQRAYFSVYEGDGTGVGKETRCGWQENRKLKDYLSEVQSVFSCVGLGRGFIVGHR